MARKAIDVVKALETRQAIWEAIGRLAEQTKSEDLRGRGLFTTRDVRQDTRCTKSQVEEYMKGLLNAGYLGLARDGKGPGNHPGTPHVYRLLQGGAVAPRVRRDGTEVTLGRGRLQMWRAMKVLGTFSVRDLVVHAATEEHQVAMNEARTYCQFLAKAGYLFKRGDAYVFQR
jgi:hypothetical protein